MHRAANISRFLIDLSSDWEIANSKSIVSQDRVLQRIIAIPLARIANLDQAFNELAQRLIPLAEHSFTLRDINTLQESSRILVSLPLHNARQIGRYYQAIALSRVGYTNEALALLGSVSENAPLMFRARAIQTAGSIYHRKGRYDEATRLYSEALRIGSLAEGRDLLTTLMLHLETCCMKSEAGDHRGALAYYESLSPLVQIVGRQNPLYFYGYHNELALELAELGRLEEAEAACEIAVNSPFAPAYPEWSETRDEIAAKRQSATSSVVAFNRVPEADSAEQTEPERQTVSVRVIASHQVGF